MKFKRLNRLTIKNYNFVAKGYARFNYNNGHSAIIRSKMAQLREICPADKVLFSGSGPGEDSLAAARKGAKVTCLDVSKKMLNICADKFREENIAGRFVCQNVLDHTEIYDAVIANYFLNVFDRKTAAIVLGHLAERVKPGGVLMIADVAPLQGSLLYRMFHLLSYWSVAGIPYLMGLTAFHIPYEYEDFFAGAGLALKWREYFREGAEEEKRPIRYKTWVAEKRTVV